MKTLFSISEKPFRVVRAYKRTIAVLFTIIKATNACKYWLEKEIVHLLYAPVMSFLGYFQARTGDAAPASERYMPSQFSPQIPPRFSH